MSKLGKALIKGLEDALRWQKGELELHTTEVELTPEGEVLRKARGKTRVEMSPDGKIERDYGSEDLNKEPGTPIDDMEPGHKKAKKQVDKVISKYDGALIDEIEPGHRKVQTQVSAVSKKDVTDPEDEYTEDGKDKKKKKKTSADNVNAIPDSHDKLEPAIEKKDFKTEDRDGAINFDKGTKVRWEKIKKALNSDKAILDLAAAQEDDEEGADEHDATAEQAIMEAMQGGAEEGDEEDTEGDMEAGDEEVDEEAGNEEAGGDEEDDHDQAEQAIMQALADEGYSEAEIRHIMHGHAPPQVDPLDQAKIDATNSKSQYDEALSQHDLENKKQLSALDTEHKQRVNDAEYEGIQAKHSVPKLEAEHRKRMLDLEYEEANSAKGAQALDITHKKRMLDLEYEMAAKEKELELEAKKKELEEKAKIKQEDMRNRQKERDMVRDSKQTSEAEKKGKKTLRKSDDEDEDLEKAKPSWSRSKTGQLMHPEHGFVNILHDGDKFTIRHAPHDGGSRTISTHGTKEEAKSALMGFMKNPKGMVSVPGGTIGGV
jgi:hypothetical protein